MTTTENKRIDLDEGAAEALNEAYKAKIREELLNRYPQILEEQDELLKKLLQDEYIKERFIEILTEEGAKELREATQFKATLKYVDSSDNIY